MLDEREQALLDELQAQLDAQEGACTCDWIPLGINAGTPAFKVQSKRIHDHLCPEHSFGHGGARPGAGRKPRKDTRAGRLVRVWLTDQEHIDVLTLSTDERREALLKAVQKP